MSDMTSAPAPHDLWAIQTRSHPHPFYARARQQGPLLRQTDLALGVPVWVATQYKAAVEALRDPRFTKDERKVQAESRRSRNADMEAVNRTMLTSDPPDHTRQRTLVSKAFTPRRMEELRPRIERITQRLLDGLRGQDTVDLIDAFAFRLPVTVIAEMLGVPAEDQDQFREWSTAVGLPTTAQNLEAITSASKAFLHYTQRLIDQRRAEPREDLISALIQAQDGGDSLTPAELVGMILLLLVAGHETTVNLIGNGVWALLRHPDQLQRLRQDPGLIGSAVEEVLRYRGPVDISTHRWALEDTEFQGQRISRGDIVFASLLAANHDPAQFSEPERFDITRDPNRHIAFGFGIHFCVGAPLARLEANVALPLLLERFPRLRMAVDEQELHWRETLIMHGLKQLPVAL
jgi:cytochrome P450